MPRGRLDRRVRGSLSIAVPDTPHDREALAKGDTLGRGRQPCIHCVRASKERWIDEQRVAGSLVLYRLAGMA